MRTNPQLDQIHFPQHQMLWEAKEYNDALLTEHAHQESDPTSLTQCIQYNTSSQGSRSVHQLLLECRPNRIESNQVGERLLVDSFFVQMLLHRWEPALRRAVCSCSAVHSLTVKSPITSSTIKTSYLRYEHKTWGKIDQENATIVLQDNMAADIVPERLQAKRLHGSTRAPLVPAHRKETDHFHQINHTLVSKRLLRLE